MELEQPAAAAGRLERDGLTPEVAAQVRYVAETAPAAWRETAPETRHALARALLDASDLALAQMFLGAAFADEAADGAVGSLRAELASAIAESRRGPDRWRPECPGRWPAGARDGGVEAALALLPGDPRRSCCAPMRCWPRTTLAALSAFHAILIARPTPR